jgi:hypothetical protein
MAIVYGEFVLYVGTDEDLEKKTKSEEFYDCEIDAMRLFRLTPSDCEFVDYTPGLAERGKNVKHTLFADAYSFKVKQK